jgi:heptosyltransferase-3
MDTKEKNHIEIKLRNKNIKKYIIFHPSAQYEYKVLPKKLRDKLLNYLNNLEIPIIITGGDNKIDQRIKEEIPDLKNIHNFIGETSLNDYFILSKSAMAYVGMDTLNMHIAASQSKRIFAIFGFTRISMWSPWSNELKTSSSSNMPVQTYGNITIFQSSIPCVICGMLGCGNNHGSNEFPGDINPDQVFIEIKKWINMQ